MSEFCITFTEDNKYYRDEYYRPNDYIRSGDELSTSFIIKWVHEDLKDGYIANHESELIKGDTDLEALKKRFNRDFFEIPGNHHEFADVKLLHFGGIPNHYYMDIKFRKAYYRYLFLESKKTRARVKEGGVKR